MAKLLVSRHPVQRARAVLEQREVGIVTAAGSGMGRAMHEHDPAFRAAFDEAAAKFAGKEFREGRSFEKAYLIDLLASMLEAGESFAEVPTPGGYMEIDTLEDTQLSEAWWRGDT